MILKNFPRGGKKPQDKKSSTSLFKQYEKSNKKNREKQKSGIQNKDETNLVASTAERLSYPTISEGLVVLGCIFEVTQYDLMISLPGGLIGRAQVTDISESYTNMLQNLIKTEDTQPNDFKPLSELYSCGDYVVCYVKSIQPQEKWQIVLSLDPKLINQNLDISYLHNGSKILCNISSIEDHGFVVDTGLTNIRAFIPTPKNNEKYFYPGKQLLCTVREIETNENMSTVKLSTKHKHIIVTNNTEIKSLDCLMPGTKFELYVNKILSNGLYVSFGSNHSGYINQLYLDEPLAKYSVGMEITGTLLYILPTVKFGYFSLMVDKSRNDAVKLGDIIDEATTLFRESGGITLQLNKNGVRGFVPLKRTNVDYDKIIEKFIPGSKHKCRVLTYSWMDAVYICTMQHSLLEQKYFSLLDLKPGDVVNIRIISINAETGFVNVQLGKINGQVAPEHVSDAGLSDLKKLKVDTEVEAKVLGISTARNKAYFTLKRSLLTSNLPVLSDIKDAECGSNYHGTIIQINNSGLLVKFFGDIKGWIPRNTSNKEASEVNWNYSVGQTVLVQIKSVDQNLGKIILTIPTEDKKREENVFTIGEHVEGTIIESSTQGVYLRISKNDGQDVSTGFLPAGHMSPCMETAALLASKCIPGDTLSALVFATTPSLILTATFLTDEKYRSFEQLRVGDCIPCSIKDIEPDGVKVILPVSGCTPFGFVSYSNVSHFKLLHIHQILFAKVFSINRKEKEINVTLSLKKVYNGLLDTYSKLIVAVDTLTLYFNKLAELAKNPFYDNRPISSVRLGQRVTGKVEKITNSGLVVALENNLQGIVSKDHYSGNLKVGDTVVGTVMWKNYVHELVELTLKPTTMKSISEDQNKQIEIPQEKLLKGRILMVTNWFILIVIKGEDKGFLAAMPVKRHMNDIQPDLSPYSVHAKIRCYIILNSNESDIVPICMVKSAFEEKKKKKKKQSTNKLKRKGMISGSEVIPVKKVKTEKDEPDVELPNKNKKGKLKTEDLEKANLKETRAKQKKEKKLKKIKQEKEEEETEDIKPFNSVIRQLNFDAIDNENEEKPRIPECGFFWDDKPNLELLTKESSSESEDDTEEQPKQKKKKLSAAERREKERQKEREIRQREEALASNQLPNSVDQFDRLVLASPDSSIIWLQYMAYHLQSTEIEKARAVARRAVKTISFREENERLNVWNAWLNLESKFGTSESLNDVFQEAVRTNDSLKVYTHMLTVHLEAGRQFELEKTINTMIGKFKQNPQVWIECGSVLLKMGLKDKSRHIMQRALQSLPASDHVNLMARFAILENKYGDKERAQTLFEQILSSYPKRVDIWSCYVDTLVKSGDVDIARKVLERAVIQTLPPRKMKSLFKKFINFEEQHGTQENVARVQQMAVEYVEKQCSQDS
ncbi:ribosomal RNA Processing 5 isoform X2 [Megachile rotundata]|uniref:ribosomal RNA Processing 5 isoform X2 n=1 Tax=Megachile rotundata TaxID=143995 RepID=UPI000614AE7B|nr:PREDICTED: protein RRP5 homolog isoform X2 [Megachile rotundata]